MILALDPGPTETGWVEYDEATRLPVAFGKSLNDVVLERIMGTKADKLAVEMVASYGMAVGAEVFETCVWAGRFIQQWHRAKEFYREAPVHCVYRREVKKHVCDNGQAKDPNVRQALIDRYGPGKAKAVGLKATPGPLYGMSGDMWAALGVAVTVGDRLAD